MLFNYQIENNSISTNYINYFIHKLNIFLFHNINKSPMNLQNDFHNTFNNHYNLDQYKFYKFYHKLIDLLNKYLLIDVLHFNQFYKLNLKIYLFTKLYPYYHLYLMLYSILFLYLSYLYYYFL